MDNATIHHSIEMQKLAYLNKITILFTIPNTP